MLDDIVNLIVEIYVVSVSICFPKDNLYTITPSMYGENWVRLLFVLYDGGMLVWMT